MPEHTAGAWQIHKQANVIITDTLGFVVSLDDVRPPNAHLIAAAPDLLGALEDAVLWYESGERSSLFPYERLRAVVAEVKGEEDG